MLSAAKTSFRENSLETTLLGKSGCQLSSAVCCPQCSLLFFGCLSITPTVDCGVSAHGFLLVARIMVLEKLVLTLFLLDLLPSPFLLDPRVR